MQDTHALPDGPRDDCPGGFVLGLADPPPMSALDAPRPPTVLPPPPRPPLAGLRRPSGDGAAAGFAVGEVHAVLGADRPPGHQQPIPVGVRDGEGVDDPQIHPGDPVGIRCLAGGVTR
nr:hypothetical protein [Micromonospora sp. U56]